MELEQTGIWMLCCVLLSLCLIAFFKCGHPIKAFCLSAFSGLSALFGVHLLQAVAGIRLPINEATLGVSAVAGIPGVILFLCCNLILS